MILGLDFDNTVICYDRIFVDEAAARGWLPPDTAVATKREVRCHVRGLPDGEAKWQQLQAVAYGPRAIDGEMPGGIDGFLTACRARGIAPFIVSHKTRYASMDPGGVDLREAALAWMERHGFFDPSGYGIAPNAVFFEDTRRDKIARIAALGCTDFVDDLEEVFREQAFPAGVRRYLFAPGAEDLPQGPFVACRSWAELGDAIL